VLKNTEFETRIEEFVAVLDNVINTGVSSRFSAVLMPQTLTTYNSLYFLGYGILNAVQCSNGAFPNWVTLSGDAADLPWEGKVL
jgi:hypothetical protein